MKLTKIGKLFHIICTDNIVQLTFVWFYYPFVYVWLIREQLSLQCKNRKSIKSDQFTHNNQLT